MNNEIMVSITCTAYNHENYIADAIEGFLMQKTDFAYEILIHDDASTDRTPEIIKEYESKYPNLIKPIYQTENQYSKGVKVGILNEQRAKGKYIAICEGDDYWIDPYKLQKQVEYMESHPECSLCVHAAYKVDPNKVKLKSNIRPNYGNKEFKTEDIIIGGGGFFATNSMLYPTVLSEKLPDFYKNSSIGDYPLCIYLAIQGTVYYIDEVMSAYRVHVPNSWTSKMLTNIKKRIEHYNEITNMLREVNEYTDYYYDSAIKKTIKHIQFNMLLEQEMFREAKTGEFREIYSTLDIINKIKLFIKQYFPKTAKSLIRLKRKLQDE